jgi:opacity protein-like surface antigen
MKRFASFIVFLFALATFANAQDQPAQLAPERQPARPQLSTPPQVQKEPQMVELDRGTHVLLVLKNAISSKNARPGDAVYLQSNFPVVQDGVVVIPAGTYVQGVIDSAKRSGRVKGRAEIQMHFTRLVYPNGYMVYMASNVGASDSSDSQRVEDKEGTVKAEGTKGRDAATIASTTGTGTLIGGLGTRSWGGAGIGAGIGAGVGVLATMLTRGNEVRFEPGSTVDMVLQRPVRIDMSRVASDPERIPPQQQRVIFQRQGDPQQPPVPVLIPR